MPTTTVRELMSDVVETLSVGDTLAAARRQLVGIVTEADFVHFARRYFEWESHDPARRSAGLPG